MQVARPLKRAQTEGKAPATTTQTLTSTLNETYGHFQSHFNDLRRILELLSSVSKPEDRLRWHDASVAVYEATHHFSFQASHHTRRAVLVMRGTACELNEGRTVGLRDGRISRPYSSRDELVLSATACGQASYYISRCRIALQTLLAAWETPEPPPASCLAGLLARLQLIRRRTSPESLDMFGEGETETVSELAQRLKTSGQPLVEAFDELRALWLQMVSELSDLRPTQLPTHVLSGAVKEYDDLYSSAAAFLRITASCLQLILGLPMIDMLDLNYRATPWD